MPPIQQFTARDLRKILETFPDDTPVYQAVDPFEYGLWPCEANRYRGVKNVSPLLRDGTGRFFPLSDKDNPVEPIETVIVIWHDGVDLKPDWS